MAVTPDPADRLSATETAERVAAARAEVIAALEPQLAQAEHYILALRARVADEGRTCPPALDVGIYGWLLARAQARRAQETL